MIIKIIPKKTTSIGYIGTIVNITVRYNESKYNNFQVDIDI